MTKKKVIKAVSVALPKPTGVQETKAAEVKALFQPALDHMAELEVEFNEIVGKAPSTEVAKAARTLRLKYVKARTATTKIHKPLKAFYLAGGRFIDGFKSSVLFAAQGNEETLEGLEKFKEVQEKAEIDKLEKDRQWKLGEFGVAVGMMPPNIGTWEQEVWEQYIAGVEAKYKEDKENELQAAKKKQEDAYQEKLEQQAKDKEIAALKAQLASASGPIVDTSILDNVSSARGVELQESNGEIIEKDDKQLALELILDLNHLSNKYTFETDQYSFAYNAMKKRFADMEKYLRTLNKTQ